MTESPKIILVTGCAGFIGFSLTQRLLSEGKTIIGVDNLNDYYDINLKHARLNLLQQYKNFIFIHATLEDRVAIQSIFETSVIHTVVNLAAQAGVRYSVTNPYAYIDSNIVGFTNILESCRYSKVEHLLFASSSSVYGSNTNMPFSVSQNVDHPVSLYAATKKANELMAHSYSHLFGLACTGLRFFTVYGPWGRPDMALFRFTKAILNNEPIQIFNYGNMRRDFTYIDDVVEYVVRLIDKKAKPNPNYSTNDPDPGSSYAPYKVYNLGNNKPVDLLTFIEILEEKLGKQAIKEYLPMQAGDVLETYADIDNLISDVDYKPQTDMTTGIHHFVQWYKSYYKIPVSGGT